MKKHKIVIAICSLVFLLIVGFIGFLMAEFIRPVHWELTFGNISTQKGEVPYGSDSLKLYLCRYFDLRDDQFFFTNPIRRTLKDGQEKELIHALHSAKYQPCKVIVSDYEYVEFTSINERGDIIDRVVIAYGLSDLQLYAFYKNNCYRIADYDTLRDTLSQFINVPYEKHYVEVFNSEVFWYNRFFFTEPIDDQGKVLHEGFVYSYMQKDITPEDIREMAIQEIACKVNIVFETEELRKYNIIETHNVYYDIFTNMWMAQVLVYYPVMVSESGNTYEGVTASYIDVFFDKNGVTEMIYDPFRVLERFAYSATNKDSKLN